MRHAAAAPRPLTGKVVLIALIAFFGLVMGVNAVMIKLAIETLPGTETDSAYLASLAFNKEIAAARDQAQRNWRVDAKVERRGDGGAIVRVEARDHNGAPITGVQFTGRLERPTDKRADKAFVLADNGAGRFRGEAEGVAPGQWELVLEGDRAGSRVFLSKNRVILN